MNIYEARVKPLAYWFGRQTIRLPHWLTIVVTVALVFGLVYQAEKLVISATPREATNQPEVQRARMSDEISVHAAGRGNPLINLSDGHELITPYSGPPELTELLERNEARSLSLCSADFDEDGVPDLISGYAGPSGGIVTLLRGNVDSIYPNAPEAQQRRAEGTFTNAPFLSPAFVFGVPEAANFIGAGDFDGDGHWDVVTAARGSDKLNLMSGDGKGGLRETKRIDLPGGVTAMVVGEINRRDGLDDVVVGVSGEQRSKVLVFEGPEGALRASPEVFELPAEATSLALGQLDNSYEMDLAVAAGRELMILHGRDRKLSLDSGRRAKVRAVTISRELLQAEIRSVVTGDFLGDHAEQVAVLTEDGIVLLASDNLKRPTRHSRRKLMGWQQAELARSHWSSMSRLVRAHLSTIPADSLVVVDSRQKRIDVLTTPDVVAEGLLPAARASGAISVALDTDGEPLAAIPMRLDIDALGDLVFLQSGLSSLSLLLTNTRPALQAPVQTAAQLLSFSNSSSIAINDNAAAVPYPSTINVSGLTDRIRKVTVTLSGISHTFPNDIDMLLVGPRGERAIILSDVGGDTPIVDVTLTLDDTAAASLPIIGPLVPGTFRPTDIEPAEDTFPGPAPTRPFSSTLSIFKGTEPNGTWSLFVVDDFTGDSGSISGGWSLTIETGVITILPTRVTTSADSGPGSLRQAILNANENPGIDTITFAIGSGVQTITPLSPLPEIIQPVTIDATTQLGFAGRPIIELSGANIGPNAALYITCGNSTVRGLVINRCGPDNLISGIELDFNGNNVIEGNFIGTDVSGTAAFANGIGVGIVSAGNIIGGTVTSARNIISGNQVGILINSFLKIAPGNVIEGNFIGVDVSGDSNLGNLEEGMQIQTASNTIGGTTAGARNVVSANKAAGVFLVTTFGSEPAEANLVQGNLIGTAVTGAAAIGNGSGNFGAAAVSIVGPNNTVGGTVPSARNIISGNNFKGIAIAGATSNIVQGNFIGADITGLRALGNREEGVTITSAPRTTLGGIVASAANLIVANGKHGVGVGTFISQQIPSGETEALIQGNFIGTDSSGGARLGNNLDGVFVENNSISNVIDHNVIAFNGGNAVRIPDDPSRQDITKNPAIQINLANNSIYANGGLGIDLGPVGVTPNPGNLLTGANLLQNFPELVSARFSGTAALAEVPAETASISITGTLSAKPTTAYRVEFFFGGDCSSGQGHQFTGSLPVSLGSQIVMTDVAGIATYTVTLPLPASVNSGGFVNATATDSVGNTSELSLCMRVTGTVPPRLTISNACKGEGKQLIINGSGFVEGAKVFLNGEQEKTSFISSTQVIAKKAGKRAVTGDTLKVRNQDGSETAVLNYTRVNCSP